MKMRQMIFDNAELCNQIDELRADTDGKFRIVFETLDQLLFIENKPKKKIGFMAKEKQARNTVSAVIGKMRETHECMGVPLPVTKLPMSPIPKSV